MFVGPADPFMTDVLARLLPGVLVLAVSIAVAPKVHAESLVMPIPPGLHLVTKSQNRDTKLFEWVGPGETASSWREMLTLAILKGLGKATPAQIEAGLTRRWLEACPDTWRSAVVNGREHGHAFSFWLLSCLQNPKTGSREITWFKAIQGRQDIFLVQRAFKVMPTDSKFAALTNHFKSVQVCRGEGCGRQLGRTVWQ